MSKFFRGDSDSDSSSEDSDREEQADNTSKLPSKLSKPKADTQKFQYDSSSSDEEKRTVRTEKDKRYEQMQNTIKTIKNHIKISDWLNVNKTLQELDKQLGKAKSITKKEGIPKFYFKIYLDVADEVEKARATTKKMNRDQAKALNAHKQNHKKWLKQWSKELVAYRKNPLTDADEKRLAQGDSDSSGSESDDDSADDEQPKRSGNQAEVSTAATDKGGDGGSDNDQSDEEDDEEWSQSDDDEDDSDDDFGAFDEGGDVGPQFTREFWVKKEFRKGYVDTTAAKKAKIAKAKEEREKRKKEEEERRKNEAEKVGKVEKKAEKKKETTPEEIIAKLKDLHAGRGRRGTNQNQVKGEIILLIQECKTTALKLKCMTFLATTLIDMTLNKGDFMAAPVWKELAKCMKDIVDILMNDPKVQLAEDEQVKDAFEEDEDDIEGLTMEALFQTEEEKKKKEEEKVRKREEEERKRREAGDAAGVQYVSGNLYSFIQVLFNEFTKSLQKIDHNTPQYVARLKDELILVDLIQFAEKYYCKINKYLFSTRIVLFHLQLLYYRYDKERDLLVINDRNKNKLAEEKKERRSRSLLNDPKPGPTDFLIPSMADGSDVHRLAAYLYKHGSDHQKINALLCHIYYFALHNRYDAGRELLLMSHVQDSINDCDYKTRIQYNRAMAQMGVAAFRAGAIREAHYALADFYQPNRIKELLAQGLMPRRKDYDQMSEREKKELQKEIAHEKLRQIPFHMHINLEVLEAVHLISAMLLEVPNVAHHGFDKRKAVSKAFRKFLDHHLKQAFNGPPENTRDSVMAASKAMLAGDWRNAWKHVSNLKVWKLFLDQELVLPVLLEQLKKDTLRTYLMNYGAQYAMVKLETLMEMFELGEDTVYKLCSKMMTFDQLKGHWDQPLNSIVMRTEEPTHMQKTALKYVEKIHLFLDNNERLIDNRAFGYDFNHTGRWGSSQRRPFTNSHFRNKIKHLNQKRFDDKKKISTRTWATAK